MEKWVGLAFKETQVNETRLWKWKSEIVINSNFNFLNINSCVILF